MFSSRPSPKNLEGPASVPGPADGGIDLFAESLPARRPAATNLPIWRCRPHIPFENRCAAPLVIIAWANIRPAHEQIGRAHV